MVDKQKPQPRATAGAVEVDVEQHDGRNDSPPTDGEQGREFDWCTDDVVIPEQAAVACYLDHSGNVVIRQAGQYHPDEDAAIIVAPMHAPALADAILEAAGVELEPAVRRRQSDPTGAERQRRYRDRRRDGRSVTERNGSDAVTLARGAE